MDITQVENDLRAVMRPTGYGQKLIELLGKPQWLDEQPFLGGETYRYEITLKNRWSEPSWTRVGLWYEPWWSEGGWSKCELDGFEEKSFECWARVPAEQGSYNPYPHQFPTFGGNHKTAYFPSLTIPLEIVQNPDALVPPQAPPTYANWTGLKSFPVPYSPYTLYLPTGQGVWIEAIRLPMLSRSHSTDGELVIRLVSPQDSNQWKSDVGEWCPLEPSRLCRTGAGFAPSYTYGIVFDFALPISITLTEDEPSDLFTVPITFPRTSKSIGSYPITVSWYVRPEGYDEYFMFWSPDVGRYHLYALIGYINVGS